MFRGVKTDARKRRNPAQARFFQPSFDDQIRRSIGRVRAEEREVTLDASEDLLVLGGDANTDAVQVEVECRIGRRGARRRSAQPKILPKNALMSAHERASASASYLSGMPYFSPAAVASEFEKLWKAPGYASKR